MGEKKTYQRCTQCVMDTTDSKIVFDDKGVCDHCRNFEKNIKPYWKPQENRFDELEEILELSFSYDAKSFSSKDSDNAVILESIFSTP